MPWQPVSPIPLLKISKTRLMIAAPEHKKRMGIITLCQPPSPALPKTPESRLMTANAKIQNTNTIIDSRCSCPSLSLQRVSCIKILGCLTNGRGPGISIYNYSEFYVRPASLSNSTKKTRTPLNDRQTRRSKTRVRKPMSGVPVFLFSTCIVY